MFEIVTSRVRRHQERDLPALIDLYESNYRRLLQLAPDLESFESGTAVSRVAGALDLYLTVIDRFKYTTTLSLTYRFETGEYEVLEPFARICVYHDVRAVEVLSHCRRKRVYAPRRDQRERMPELNRRWELNRFLLKWLRFCTHQGHIFLSCTTRRDPVADDLIRRYQPPASSPEPFRSP